MKKLIFKSFPGIKCIFFCLPFFITVSLCAQNTSSIIGKVLETKSNQPVPFATIRLEIISNEPSGQLTGTISNEDGSFEIKKITCGKYRLQVSSMGYEPAIQTIEVSTPETMDIGIVYLQESVILIPETVITGNRIKGKSTMDKNVYFVDRKILNASGNTHALLRHIPGVQVDLKQNISIDGNSNILLFVNGKEYDKSYINQINPSLIEKVEVLNTPPPNYEGNASGVLNIILKKDIINGFSGHLFTEIPTSTSIIYSFPTSSLNYSYKKINLYTSYNGVINYEDIEEKNRWQIASNNSLKDISSVQYVKQKNVSHKFHYGVDYHLTPRDIVNFYGYYNNYSYEQDGNVVVRTGKSGIDEWNVQKEETDRNQSLFNSLYYKHLFNNDGNEITFDVSNARIRSENNIIYRNNSVDQINSENPRQTGTSLKVDYTAPFSEEFKLNTGAKLNTTKMHDNTSDGFRYDEQTYALYGSLKFKKSKFGFNVGIRVEDAESELNNTKKNSSFSWLPYTTIHYSMSEKNNLYLSFRRSVNRPSVYLLNSYSYSFTPYSIRRGNPLLSPEFHTRLQLEYASRFKSSFISMRLFYQATSNAINNLTYLNENQILVTQVQNLGDIHQYGVQLTGTLNFGILTINPSFRVYNRATAPNNRAQQYGIKNKKNIVFESGISSILSFNNDFALSVVFQYETAKQNIQDNTYFDALYFISLDKTFRKKVKFGIVSALPFAKTFVYQGSNIMATDFRSKYTGHLKLPAIPIMLRFSYQFSFGQNRGKLEREKENVVTRQRQGF